MNSLRYFRLSPFILNMTGYSIICDTGPEMNEPHTSGVLRYHGINSYVESQYSNMSVSRSPTGSSYIFYLMVRPTGKDKIDLGLLLLAMEELKSFCRTHEIIKLCVSVTEQNIEFWEHIDLSLRNFENSDIIVCYPVTYVEQIKKYVIDQDLTFPGPDFLYHDEITQGSGSNYYPTYAEDIEYQDPEDHSFIYYTTDHMDPRYNKTPVHSTKTRTKKILQEDFIDLSLIDTTISLTDLDIYVMNNDEKYTKSDNNN